ncbi:MAG: hemolysin family protein, partial [Candidatus Kariarchaeaceae archaeon]
MMLSKNIPQFISIKYSEKILTLIVIPLRLYTILISPFLWVMRITNNFALKVLKIKYIPGESPALTEEELKRMIAKSEDEGIIETEEEEMLYNVFELQDLLAKEIMTPRPFVISLEVNSSYQKVINIAHETGYSRFPIYEEKFDNILGVLHVKDLTLTNNNDEFILKDIMRDVIKIPETKSVFSLLRSMQHSKIQLAIIFDEFGVISGIITLEDILEELVGEIEDEYDKESDLGIKKLNDFNYLVRGELNVGELKKELGIDVETNGAISAGGFLIEKFDHIPLKGEVIEYNDDQFEVVNVQNNRITLIKITLDKIKEDEGENNLAD